jgi:hypothetical protein
LTIGSEKRKVEVFSLHRDFLCSAGRERKLYVCMCVCVYGKVERERGEERGREREREGKKKTDLSVVPSLSPPL